MASRKIKLKNMFSLSIKVIQNCQKKVEKHNPATSNKALLTIFMYLSVFLSIYYTLKNQFQIILPILFYNIFFFPKF